MSWGAFTQRWIGPWELCIASAFQTTPGRWPALVSGRFQLQRAEYMASGLSRGAQCGTWNGMPIHWEGWQSRLSAQKGTLQNWGHQRILFYTQEAVPSPNQSHQNWKATAARKLLPWGSCLEQESTAALPRGPAPTGMPFTCLWVPGEASTWALEPQKKQVPPR